MTVTPPRSQTLSWVPVVRIKQHAPSDASGPGWAPVIALIGAIGLLAFAIATVLARQSPGVVAPPTADILYWAAIFLVTVPGGARLLSTRPAGGERLFILVVIGLGLYLIKMLHDPTMFTFFDEFLHVRSTEDILRTSRLFDPSPMLPVSPSFPGLEISTAAIVSMSGQSIFVAGAVLLAVARVLLVVSLYLFYVRIGGTERLAGIAAFIYMANPNFLFFVSQFAYESLAIPFAVFALYVVARRQYGDDPRLRSWLLVGLAITATVITHHVTAFALIAFLALWGVAALVLARRGTRSRAPLMPAVLAGVVTFGWLVAVAGIVVGYLGPAVTAAANQIVSLTRGDQARQLFSASGAPQAELWERVIAYLGILALLLGLAWGLWVIWRRGNLTAPVAALAVGALAYPASLAGRLTESGAILSDRAMPFVFVAVGFVVAAGLDRRRFAASATTPPLSPVKTQDPARGAPRRWKSIVQPAMLVLIMASGVALSFPVWARLPGAYLVSADPRSIEPEGIAAAQWTAGQLGRENRFVVDRVNRLLLGAIGDQHPVIASFDQVRVRSAFFSPELGRDEIKVLGDAQIDYVLTDQRLSSALPVVGVYYEKGEISGGRWTEPIAPEVLAKFDGVDDVSRIFDSGDIQIYDLRTLTAR